MMTGELIEQYIRAGMECTHLEINGDGQHFFAKIVSPAFAGKRLVERHRMVMEIIKARLATNEIHALSIVKAQTPEEWQTSQSQD